MATHDVPGSNPANKDELHAGCWAEHEDGSLLYVKGTERDQVVYELYDLNEDPPVYYQDAMDEKQFKESFGWSADIQWTWHDKTPMPWERVMKNFERPRPNLADVHDTLSAAARVAQSLRLRAQRLAQSDVDAQRTERKGRPILERISRALEELVG